MHFCTLIFMTSETLAHHQPNNSRETYLYKANSAVHPSGVGKWVPASAGKAKAGMVHSVSGWTRGVQVNCLIPENACHTWAPLEVCSRLGAIQIHVYVYLTLPLTYDSNSVVSVQFVLADISRPEHDILLHEVQQESSTTCNTLPHNFCV